MQKCEFEKRLGAEVSEQDYKKIETVYNWYPVDLDKDAIAALYKEFGMTLIVDMLPRAMKASEIETKLRSVRSEERKLQDQLEELKTGGDIGA